MNLKEILKLKEVRKFSGSNKVLLKLVKQLAKENVGHGISKEYYETRFETGTINANNIDVLIKNANKSTAYFNLGYMRRCLKAKCEAMKTEA